MGRYYRDRKHTAEECLILHIFEFARRGYLTAGRTGTCQWLQGETEVGIIGWATSPDGLRLFYIVTSRATGQATDYNYIIPIVRTAAGFGGERR